MCEFDLAQTYSIALQLDTVSRKEFVELTYSLSSDVAMVSPFVDDLMHTINILRAMDGTEVDIEVALREALLNAIIHGNRGTLASAFTSEYAAVQTEKSR